MGWLAVRDVEVALMRSGRQLPEHHSQRPYLHPVRTLAGEVLTQSGPDDHPHHHGLSLAIADVNGTSFWGGPSYVADQGYVMLANHGRQHGPPPQLNPDAVVIDLDWTDVRGQLLARERRTLTAHPWDDGWALHWRTLLTAGDQELRLGSPATRGRTGAGYGGLFWRMSDERPTRVTTESGEGVARAHGSTSPWLALEQSRGQGRTATLLLAQQPPAPQLPAPQPPAHQFPVHQLPVQQAGVLLPWFVRTESYVGAGPAVAWSQPRIVPPGHSLELVLVAGLLDRGLCVGDAQSLLAHSAGLAQR